MATVDNVFYEIVDADYNNTGQYRTYYRQAVVDVNHQDPFVSDGPDLVDIPQGAFILKTLYWHFD